MKSVADQKIPAASRATVLRAKQVSLPALTILLISVAVTLIGIFGLSGWAEANPLHHGIQHVIIFLSGAGFGGSFVSGYLRRRAKPDES